MYDHDDALQYNTYLGKRIQQNLHFWYHWYYAPKRYYGKDPKSAWYRFYIAFNTPTSTSEKIVDICHHGVWGSQYQLWVLYNIKNYYWR